MCTAVLHNRANSCSYSITNPSTDYFTNSCTECRSDISANV